MTLQNSGVDKKQINFIITRLLLTKKTGEKGEIYNTGCKLK